MSCKKHRTDYKKGAKAYKFYDETEIERSLNPDADVVDSGNSDNFNISESSAAISATVAVLVGLGVLGTGIGSVGDIGGLSDLLEGRLNQWENMVNSIQKLRKN